MKKLPKQAIVNRRFIRVGIIEYPPIEVIDANYQTRSSFERLNDRHLLDDETIPFPIGGVAINGVTSHMVIEYTHSSILRESAHLRNYVLLYPLSIEL